MPQVVRAFSRAAPATAAELAQRTGTAERYCQERLEMQASFGTLTVEHGSRRCDHRFTLSPGPAEVLTDEHTLAFLGALPSLITVAARQIDPLLKASRTGGG